MISFKDTTGGRFGLSAPLPACGSSTTRPELDAVTASRLLRGIAVHGIDPQHRLRLLDRLDVEVDRDRLAVAANQNAFQHLIAAGIDLLMRHVGRDEDEIAGPR